MDNHLSELLGIFGEKVIGKKSNFGGRYFSIHNFDVEGFAHVQEILTRLNIQFEGDAQELIFDLNHNLAPDTLLFYEKEHFLAEHSYERYNVDFDKKTIIVLLQNGEIIFKNPGDEFSVKNALIVNYINYRKILSVMSANTFFVSLHSPAAQQIIILSVKYGSYNIGYKLAESRVKSCQT